MNKVNSTQKGGIIIKTPTQVADRLTKFIDAWKELAPDKSFGDMTLDQFKAEVKPSFDTRDEVRTLTAQLADAVNRRMVADTDSVPVFQRAVAGVKADKTMGDDSSLYEAGGYICRSEKRAALAVRPRPPCQRKRRRN